MTYHKINALYKRDSRGKLIPGDWAVPEFGYLADNDWEFTEKVDGTNIRINISRYEDNCSVEFAGRTDNAEIPKHLLAALRGMFDTENFNGNKTGAAIFGDWPIEKLRGTHSHVVLYGEGYGPKIQAGGGNYRKDASFVLFDVRIDGFWLDRANVDDIARKLGIDSVPVIGYGTLYQAESIVRSGQTVAGMSVEKYGPGYLKSQWGDFEAEGIVARPVVPLFNRKGERIIAKIKGKDYK
jgi:hypothetical protein